MSPIRPMLEDLELQQVQQIVVDEEQVLTAHRVAALEGDFLQGLARRSSRLTLAGVLSGPGAAAGLRDLRGRFRAIEPVSFTADIATATRLDQVLIQEMTIRELSGKPERFEYAITLRQFVQPPPPTTEAPAPPPPSPPPPPPPSVDTGTLVVEVVVEGQPDFDFGAVQVTVEGG